MNIRKIIHIDMDAFYASIEQRDNPEYRNKAVAVGYSGTRGVVAAASYEARKYGVHSAMSSKLALRKCPQLIFVPARFNVYRSVSAQIMDIFHEYTDLVEPLSLDEAFLDVTENYKGMPSATLVAREIKKRILEETNLTASAGVSFNKFLAKIASDYNKPNGLFVVKPDDTEKFVEELPVEKFPGVGRVTTVKMHSLGIFKGIDLKNKQKSELIRWFGKAGNYYYNNSRAIDEREVKPNRIRKSIGAENTFADDIGTYEELERELKEISEEVFSRVSKKSFSGRTITLKIKYADFKIITRSKTLMFTVNDYETLYKTSRDLLYNIDITPTVRLLGVSVKKTEHTENYTGPETQLEIDFN